MRPELAEARRRADRRRGRRSSAATVVRRQRPIVACAPATARSCSRDGTIEGFVGGACAEESVRLHALRVLETGEPLLLRIVAGRRRRRPRRRAPSRSPTRACAAARSRSSSSRTCPPRGWSWSATRRSRGALRELRAAGCAAEVAGTMGAVADDAAAVVVAAARARRGGAVARGAARRACRTSALVASRRRGAATVAALRDGRVEADARRACARPRASTSARARPHEVALSVLAEIVATRHAAGSRRPHARATRRRPPAGAPPTHPSRPGDCAVDPCAA